MSPDLGDYLDNAKSSQPFHRVADRRTGAGHMRTAQGLEGDALDHVGQLASGTRLPSGPNPHELATPAGEVEREVTIRLEQAEAADPLPRHSGCSSLGDGAVGK